MASLWERLRSGLTRTRQALVGRLDSLWSQHRGSPALWEELEEALLAADVGVAAARALVDSLRERAGSVRDADGLRRALAERIAEELRRFSRPLALEDSSRPRPRAAMLVGVNGSGKTTTAGKLAFSLRQKGQRVLLVAADTFRAAACEQLRVWAQRAGADILCGSAGQDPAAVAFDGVQAACAREFDAVLVDTAGRLHNKSQLMAELAKVRRVVEKGLGRAPDEVLLVLDATTGQNGLAQARVFTEAVQVSGLVLAKLDGTARGGVALAIGREFGLPIKLVGVGEGPDDLRPFDPDAFAWALLGLEPSVDRAGPGGPVSNF